MSTAPVRLKVWWWPLLLFLIALVAAALLVVGRRRSVDGLRDAVTRTTEAPSAHSEKPVIASAAGTVIVPASARVAEQKPGPPDPESVRTAADSAVRAAEAAADLAGSVAATTH